MKESSPLYNDARPITHEKYKDTEQLLPYISYVKFKTKDTIPILFLNCLIIKITIIDELVETLPDMINF